MPSTNEDLARVIGFLNPQVIEVRLKLGEHIRVRGITANGQPYELRHEIIDLDNKSITLTVEGEFGKGGRLRNNILHFNLPLRPNEPFRIPKMVDFGQPDLYIAFIASSASQFRPIPGRVLVAAVGEVRDTVPPPPPKK